MKNYEQILQGLGIEIPEDKKSDLKKEMSENYRTISDYNKVAEKRDEYKKSLDDVQEKLDGFKDVNVDDMKKQIEDLQKELKEEKESRAEEAKKAETEKMVREFLGKTGENGEKIYEFLNDITENHYRNALIEELGKDSAKGRSVEDIFTLMITDQEGKQKDGIFVNKFEQNKARFTNPNKPQPQKGKKYSISELMKMKNENPGLDITQYME